MTYVSDVEAAHVKLDLYQEEFTTGKRYICGCKLDELLSNRNLTVSVWALVGSH